VTFPIGGATSSTHVERRRGRGSWVVAVVAACSLAVAGAVALAGREPSPDDGPAPVAQAYLTAAKHLLAAPSFSYTGTVHAAAPSPLRPGRPPDDVTVEGTVHLPLSITRERAEDERGRAVEVATSGASVWTRSAPRTAGLEAAPWHVEDAGSPAPRLGVALVADAIRSGAGPRELERDEDGRRVVRARLPADDAERADRCRHCEPIGAALAGGSVTVTLGPAGDVVRADLRSAGPDLRLDLDLDVLPVGDVDRLPDPADVAAPALGALPLADLAAVGVAPVALGSLPEGWALTDAAAGLRFERIERDCPWLSLQYHDLRVAWRTEGVRLVVTPESCPPLPADPRSRPFAAGAFVGSIALGNGTLSDGRTRVEFSSFLPDGRVGELLATLQPLTAPS
jgi:hypothetical protein